MPNWCYNNISVWGPKTDMEKFLEAVRSDEKFPHFNFNGVVPMPEELVGTESPNTNEELAAKFTEKYGSPDWYTWALNNWGTKWNCTAINEWDVSNFKDGVLIASIDVDTAWSPPTQFLLKASEIYCTLTFDNEFYEEGNCFLGYHTIKNGDFSRKHEPEWDSEEGIEARKNFGIYNEEEESEE